MLDRNTCTACSHTGHIQKICIQTLLKQRSNKDKTRETSTNYIDSTSIQDFYGINLIIDVYQKCHTVEEDLEKYYADVIIEGNKNSNI